MRSTSALVLALLPAALLCSAVAKAVPITVSNPGFETTTLTGSSEFGSAYAGQVVGGWTASGYTFLFKPGTADTTGANSEYGNLQLWGPGNGSANGLPATSPAGGNFLGLDGAFNDGSISQTLTGLTVGMVEEVSFWYAGAQQYGYNGATTEGFKVTLGNQTDNTTQLLDASHGFTGWQYATLRFTATSSTETLTFLAKGTPTGVPPFTLLDGVGVVETTPEPSSLIMLGTGALGLAGAARRRFRRTA